MKNTVTFAAFLAALPAVAEDTRQLSAHEHGVGALNIAIDGAAVAMEFHAPGADIVGFEHAAETDKARAAIDAALALLQSPLALFVLPEAAGCSLISAHAELEGDEHNSAHEEHEEHEEHHGDTAGHSEFHADYALTCAAPDAITTITFAYFTAFPNAQEVEVQILTTQGARAIDVARDAPVLALGR